MVSKGTHWPPEDWDGGRGCPRALCNCEWERTETSSVIRFLRAELELRWSGIASAGGGGALKTARAGSREDLQLLCCRDPSHPYPPLSQGGRCYSGKIPSPCCHLPNRGVGSLGQTKTKPFIFLCRSKHRGPCWAWGGGAVSVEDSARAESGGQYLSLEH